MPLVAAVPAAALLPLAEVHSFSGFSVVWESRREGARRVIEKRQFHDATYDFKFTSLKTLHYVFIFILRYLQLSSVN